jgi:hypothetical protein
MAYMHVQFGHAGIMSGYITGSYHGNHGSIDLRRGRGELEPGGHPTPP